MTTNYTATRIATNDMGENVEVHVTELTFDDGTFKYNVKVYDADAAEYFPQGWVFVDRAKALDKAEALATPHVSGLSPLFI